MEQNEKQLVRYLLGELSDEEQSQLDEQMFVNDEYFERLMVTEDELIEDYLRDRLSVREQQSFERTFLTSPHLRRRVDVARSLLDFIDGKARIVTQSLNVPTFININASEKYELERRYEVAQILKTGRRQYAWYLEISSVFRLGLLVLVWLLLLRAASISSVDLQDSFFWFKFSLVCYAGLELLNLLSSLRTAKLALADTRLHEMTSSER